MNNDLISRSDLKKALEVTQYNDIDDLTRTERLIDNAPTVDAISNEEGYEMYNKGYMSGYERGKKERPQGDLADEVWKLYEKYHSHLATNVLEFGDELKDLLGKDQKGGAE